MEDEQNESPLMTSLIIVIVQLLASGYLCYMGISGYINYDDGFYIFMVIMGGLWFLGIIFKLIGK